MSLLQKLDDDLKSAMKTSDKLKVSTIRMVKASLKNREIERRGDLSEDDIVSILASLSKQRKESIEQFANAGRDDLANQEKKELEILQEYMPKQLNPEELDEIISESIRETAAEGIKDMGKVMRMVMSRVKGSADGKTVNQRVRYLLEGA
jgi:uncharacterized protein YqeY